MIGQKIPVSRLAVNQNLPKSVRSRCHGSSTPRPAVEVCQTDNSRIKRVTKPPVRNTLDTRPSVAAAGFILQGCYAQMWHRPHPAFAKPVPAELPLQPPLDLPALPHQVVEPLSLKALTTAPPTLRGVPERIMSALTRADNQVIEAREGLGDEHSGDPS